MVIKLPEGRKHEIPEGYRLIGKLLFPEIIESLQTKTIIEKEKYALMREGNEATSAISMIQGFNGKNYLDTHSNVISAGLYIPSSAKFMPQVRNVNEALKETIPLYDTSGKLIEGERLNKYAQTINRASWVWLNSGFPKGKGFNGLDLATITGLDERGNPVMSIAPLEDCLEEDCWADLESLNKQGFPTKKAPIESYKPGKTFYFWTPREGAVARWFANSGRAGLICGRFPANRSGSLGVFASAEGASVAENK
jgi:hypothetical protein